MTQAKSGDTVQVHYTGTLNDGSQFDSSHGADPIQFTIGDGNLIAGFEQAIIGMAAGDNKSVTIPSDQAYGPHHKDLVHEVQREQIPPEIGLEVGSQLQASGPNGEPVRLVVVGLTDDTATLDANHPLAGEDLTFALELVAIV